MNSVKEYVSPELKLLRDETIAACERLALFYQCHYAGTHRVPLEACIVMGQAIVEIHERLKDLEDRDGAPALEIPTGG